jgi:hypothetical protein
MRLIFKPSARESERWPSRVGFGSVGGNSAAVFIGAIFDFATVVAAAVFALIAAADAELEVLSAAGLEGAVFAAFFADSLATTG